MSTDYKQLLNQPQYEAVTYNDGPSLIVAGAGSGKTRVLTYKISYLIESGFPASSILALTFTNKAAREMKERIAKVVGEKFSRYLWMGTFHSIFSRILRAEAEKIGFTRDFTIYDAADSKGLIRDIIKEMELDEKKYKVKDVVNRISYAKNNIITAEMYENNSDYRSDDCNRGVARIFEVYKNYSERCRISNAMDFDDLLMYVFLLFKEHPEVLEYYQQRFEHILVDEYQDTNVLQHRIVTMLAQKYQHISVVGDDAQSIYSFRGAEIDNMLKFQRTFPTCKLFKLEQNYRSTQTIVNAANSLISNNNHQIPKTLFSNLELGDKITVHCEDNEYLEALSVVEQIKRIVRRNRERFIDLCPYSKIAILYRKNSQSRLYEERLRKESIPFKIFGGVSFYQRKEIKDALAYMRLVINSEDEEAFKRIINYPARKIGAVTQKKILDVAHRNRVSPMYIINHIDTLCVEIKGSAAQKIVDFGNMISEFTSLCQEMDAFELSNYILERSGIYADIAGNDDEENKERRENIEELQNEIKAFCEKTENIESESCSLRNFLSEVSLLTDQDVNAGDSEDYVSLMTIHAAKGLEFPYVFIVGMNEEVLPCCNSQTAKIYNPKELEEERRLCYVALTRAQQACYLVYSNRRRTFFVDSNGKSCSEESDTAPSCFIEEMGTQFLKLPNSYFKSFNRNNSTMFDFRQLSKKDNFPPREHASNIHRLKPIAAVTSQQTLNNIADASKIQAGIKVRHANFGEGVVLSVEGTDASSRKAVIRFQTAGERTLLLKYAKLEIIQ